MPSPEPVPGRTKLEIRGLEMTFRALVTRCNLIDDLQVATITERGGDSGERRTAGGPSMPAPALTNTSRARVGTSKPSPMTCAFDAGVSADPAENSSAAAGSTLGSKSAI